MSEWFLTYVQHDIEPVFWLGLSAVWEIKGPVVKKAQQQNIELMP